MAAIKSLQVKMKKNNLKSKLFQDLSLLYARMEASYNLTALQLGLSCEGCPDNCCNSFFQHHTYIEWAYLWEGVNACSHEKRQEILEKAGEYVGQSRILLARGKRPRIMCPLNDDGLCRLYGHRLMICRMHGVPNSFVRPDEETMRFPGCVICQKLYADKEDVPMLDRTLFYKDLAALEMSFLKLKGTAMPRVKLTLAEMLAQGPPNV